MSWSIEEHIGEGRPWPAQVTVYRGETDESLIYVRRSLSDINRINELMTALVDENEKLQELVAEMLDNLMPEICAKAFWCRDKDWRKCKDDACGNYTFVILARELGVEVDG